MSSKSKSTLLNYFQPIINEPDRVSSILAIDDEEQPLDLDLDSPETFFDLPPESFWLPECHEQDWFQLNAVLERKRSKKFSSAAGGINSIHHHHRHTSFKSSSSRFFWPSVKNQKKTCTQLIIGPLDPRKSRLVGRNNKAEIARLFRSRSEPGGKLVMEASEPDSPRVSCMGRVGTDCQTLPKKIGIWRSFKSIFRSRTGFA